jgi:hypothetical protein
MAQPLRVREFTVRPGEFDGPGRNDLAAVEREALALWSKGQKQQALRLLEQRLASESRGSGPAAARYLELEPLAPSAAPRRAPRRPLLRLGLAALFVVAAGWGAAIGLVTFVHPDQREVAIDIPAERLLP